MLQNFEKEDLFPTKMPPGVGKISESEYICGSKELTFSKKTIANLEN